MSALPSIDHGKLQTTEGVKGEAGNEGLQNGRWGASKVLRVPPTLG